MNSYIEEHWSSVGLGFNPWDYSRAEKHGILLAVFKNLNILAVLELPPSDVLDFCLDIEALYTDVPYHSFNHAIDVVVKLYYVLSDLQASSYLASYDIACLIISGICHDAGHPGLNNLFQKNADTELAKRYPDAILERYSMDLAEEYINKHRLLRNVENLRDPMYGDNTVTETDIASRMIFSVRAAILNTDMSRHFEVVEKCKALVSELSKKARCMSKHEAYQRECSGDSSISIETPVPTTRSKTVGGSSPGNSKVVSTNTILARARSPSAPAFSKNGLIGFLRNNKEPLPSTNAKQTHLHGQSTESSESVSHVSTPSADDSVSGHTSSNSNSSRSSSSNNNNNNNNNNSGKLQVAKRRLQVRRSISMSDALLDSSQRQILIGILLHAVDIFNPVLPWSMCKKWSDLMNAESFCQGELEKTLSLPVSPNMDRETADQRQVSLDFGSIIVRPFLTEVVSLFPVDDALLPALEANLQKWSRLSPDTSHEISPPVGANSNMYSWPANRASLSASCSSASSSFSDGRRLSIAAGTVDIPPSRLEMIRRHSHEGFEALHRRMVGRLFSKHLEKIQERRKVSYTGTTLRLPLVERQHQRPPYACTTISPIAGGSTNVHAGRIRSNRNFGADMLSPVTEATNLDDSGASVSSSESGTDGGCSVIARKSLVDTPVIGTASTSVRNADPLMPIVVDRHRNDILQGPASASWDIGGINRPMIHGFGRNTAAQPEDDGLYSYRINTPHDPADGRQYRSASLDPTVLSNMPSTYPSLSDGKPSKLQHELSKG
ncbi:hypothetical protein GGI22_000913 [Coemansia erecta]|nr:hypothetical protein GGI22_000913 [Coemansia erecta]